MLQTILQIILLFIFINLAILLGGLEGWFGWELAPLISFVLVFGKAFLLLSLGKLIMIIFKVAEAPLLIAGLVFGILIIFGNSYYGDFQKAFYQKQNIGGALEIKASELGQVKNLHRTPYLKIVSSGLGEIKTFQRNVGKPDMPNVINYCYGEILNTKEPAFVVDYCLRKNRQNKLTLEEMKNEQELVAEMLSRKAYFHELKGLQFSLTQKTFGDYYQKQFRYFLNFIKIVNGIGLIFVLIFLAFKRD